jgi:hypothetical protein
LCVHILQQNEQPEDRIHLMWSDGTVLCGQEQPKRFWQNWTLNALNWSDIVCQSCVDRWMHPTELTEEPCPNCGTYRTVSSGRDGVELDAAL